MPFVVVKCNGTPDPLRPTPAFLPIVDQTDSRQMLEGSGVCTGLLMRSSLRPKTLEECSAGDDRCDAAAVITTPVAAANYSVLASASSETHPERK